MKLAKRLWIGLCLLLICGVLIGIFRDPIIDWLPIDQSGWDVLENGSACYLDEDGDPLSGWQKLGTATYYFDPESGALHSGWLELENSRYYLNEDGIMQAGWQAIDGARYYLGDDGVMHTGWLDQLDGRMYLNDAGNPHCGWLELDEGKYYLNENGILQTGWLELDGTRYYLEEDGLMATGWVESENGKYYLGDNGAMTTGWQTVQGNRYYLGSDGILQTGWLELDGQKYYLKEDGSAAKGKLVIDEVTYYFTSTGANIVLVNRWNPLPADFEPEVEECYPGCLMDISCCEATREFLDALKAATGDAGILNGYRTYGTQYQGFYTKIKNRMKATGCSYSTAYASISRSFAIPGTSEHQLGVALDIMGSGDFYYQNGETEAVTWLKEHCWEYGFILRYPDDKSHITGIIYEPWHFRYVGTELAMEMKDSGLCLEEYLDTLTNDGTTCGNPDALKE